MLMLEYCKAIFNLPGMNWKTTQILLFDQVHNLYYLLTVYLSIYMINVLFNMTPSAEQHLLIPGHRQSTSIVVALLYVIPFSLLHLWDFKKEKMDLGGHATEWVQCSLFRKYLNYSEKSHDKVPPSAIALAVIDEAKEIVDKGYMKMFTISQVL